MRAWDAGDEYLLNHLAEVESLGDAWLIMNDSFGALACGLVDHGPQWLSDSYVSSLGATDNLERNSIDASSIRWLASFEDPNGPLDVVVIKVPKTLSLLEDQLYRLRPLLHADSLVVGAGMVKHIHRSTLELFEKILGQTTTSLAKKKARLIHTQFDPDLTPGQSPHPVRYTTDGGLEAVNHAGIFSQAKLDIGTRFLLEQLPVMKLGTPASILDLGCGNGLLGAALGRRFDSAQITFVDESHRAVRSANETWAANHGDRQAAFVTTDVLDAVADQAIDLVVNNPPFHDQHAISDSVALRMFSEARRVLRPGGRLIVVGNRNLSYHSTLARLFADSSTITGNKKFVILSATKA